MSIVAAMFRVALACCPPAFRREYGTAILHDFTRAFEEERATHGRLGAARYGLGATGDLITTSLRETAAMLGRDLSFAARSLRKTPAFTAIVVSTLAIAIGANAAVFSLMNAIVLAPLPYANADRLVALDPKLAGLPFAMSLPEYVDVMRQNASTYDAGAAYTPQNVTLTGNGRPRREDDVQTTPRLFETLGASVQLGRFGRAADTLAGAPQVVVISDAMWREQFGADPQIVGRIVRLDGDAYHIIGVAAPGFVQPGQNGGFAKADLWTFLAEDGTGTSFAQRGYHAFRAIARLRDGVSLESARAASALAVAYLRARHPDDDTTFGLDVKSLADFLVGSVRPVLFALFAAVGAVLLVACANVANLLLSRAAAREREFSVRVAVGASRGRIITQLLVEAFALSLAGGVLGIGLAFALIDGFASLRVPNIPRADHVGVDLASVLFTLGVVVFCTFAAGIVPGLATSTRDVATALKSAGRGGDASRGARTRGALVAAEIAVTLALVVAAGLVVRSYIMLTAQPLGFDPHGVTIVGPIDIPDNQVPTQTSKVALLDRIERSARSVPGVDAADWGYNVPFTRSQIGSTLTIAGRSYAKGLEPNAKLAIVGPAFFHTIGATLLKGREFLATDRNGAAPAVIVNEAFEREFFAGGSAIGKRVTPSVSFGGPPHACTIVGVVNDMRVQFAKPAPSTIYLPYAQYAFTGSFLVVRASGAVTEDIDRAIASADPLLPRPDAVSLDSLLARDVAQQRLTVAALCALGFIALSLSLAGVFAVMSYGVTQRTHEFGVRMALGADARKIVWTVLGGAVRLALAGVVAGLILAGAGTRLLADELYETEPLDPAVFAGVAVLVIVAALVAAAVPARRATRVDPIVALRYE